jgi:DNA-binding beta-propeller fold protein YncE
MLPRGVAVDGSGRVFVADTFNHRLQEFSRSLGYLRVWGCAGDLIGQLAGPRAVATAPDGSVYVADTMNRRVQRFVRDVSSDSVPPVTSCLAPDDWTPAPVLIELAAADDGGVAVTYWRLGGEGPYLPYVGPLTVATPGVVLLQYLSVDEAGNQERTRSQRLYVGQASGGPGG